MAKRVTYVGHGKWILDDGTWLWETHGKTYVRKDGRWQEVPK